MGAGKPRLQGPTLAIFSEVFPLLPCETLSGAGLLKVPLGALLQTACSDPGTSTESVCKHLDTYLGIRLSIYVS